MASLSVRIVTPEALLWSGSASALMARSTNGLFTVLAQHTAMVGDLVPDVVRVQSEEGEVAFAVHGGYFQVGPGESEGETLALVLAGIAERTDEIDVGRAEAAKARAEAALNAPTTGNPEDHAPHLWAHDALARAELRLRAAAR